MSARGSVDGAPALLLLTGQRQVRSVAAAIAGDRYPARTVDLVLPETACAVRPRQGSRPRRRGVRALIRCTGGRPPGGLSMRRRPDGK
jgi:hypothetical protein